MTFIPLEYMVTLTISSQTRLGFLRTSIMSLGEVMKTVNILEAKSTLSKLVESVETGKEKEIVIARNGRPVARLTKIDLSSTSLRIGIAKGVFAVPESIDNDNDAIASLFHENEGK